MKALTKNPNKLTTVDLFKNFSVGMLTLVIIGSNLSSESVLADGPTSFDPSNAQLSPKSIKVSFTAESEDTDAPEQAPDKQAKLNMGDFLDQLKMQTNSYSTPNINDVLTALHKSHDDDEMHLVTDWIVESQKSSLGIAYHIAEQFSKHEDYTNAYRWYHIAAKKVPSPAVLYQLGIAELLGKGTPTNYARAKRNLYQSVRNEHPDAAYLLGVVHLSGLQTETNPRLAYQWFQKSIAKEGNKGFSESGRMRETGYGVEKDIERAIEIYEKGAELGDHYCSYRLKQLTGGEESDTVTLTEFTPNTYQALLPNEFLFPAAE